MQQKILVPLCTENQSICDKNEIKAEPLLTLPEFMFVPANLENENFTDRVQKEIVIEAFTSKPLGGDNWALGRILTEYYPPKSVYQPICSGNGVVVYLMDSGVNQNLPAFNGAKIQNLYSYNGDFKDHVGHGTFLAGLMVSGPHGVSPNITLKSVKIFDKSRQTSSAETLIAAFEAILADHRTCPHLPKIINMSWGAPIHPLLRKSLMALHHAGIHLVAASGTSGKNADLIFPASENTVITVGATDKLDCLFQKEVKVNYFDIEATLNNYGKTIDLFAPGDHVTSISAEGHSVAASGSSISAALTTAVMALHLEKNPSDSPSAAKKWLISVSSKGQLIMEKGKLAQEQNCLLYNPYQDLPPEWLTSPGLLGRFDVTEAVDIPLNATPRGDAVSLVNFVNKDGDLPPGIKIVDGRLQGKLTEPIAAVKKYTFTLTATAAGKENSQIFALMFKPTHISFMSDWADDEFAVTSYYAAP